MPPWMAALSGMARAHDGRYSAQRSRRGHVGAMWRAMAASLRGSHYRLYGTQLHSTVTVGNWGRLYRIDPETRDALLLAAEETNRCTRTSWCWTTTTGSDQTKRAGVP